ncbi:TonB-dependent receptor [Paracoccus onubensis]|uniref:TonB-dependent receptor n=1 Tax=Paracoccus onubensis TaxID=1675788 RepID=A0A418SN04_9RHOB|nr:TonB-dependent receptor [Paracoccus onubensis]RJE82325.1 TonB-dependent receptor [Paracoccus onubensis]
MNGRFTGYLLGSVALAAFTVTGAIPAAAQDAGTQETTLLKEIILTGEKTARSLDQTASSAAVVTTSDIEDNPQTETISEAISNVPNISYANQGGLGGAPTIRGQDSEGPNSGATAFFGGTQPRTSINLDGHYLSYNELVFSASSLWDVESIEVFRGPQTVTQGANSIAGAIIVNTKDPTFQPEGAVQLEYGSRSKRRVSLMASGPVATDLAARVALDYSARDTFIDYTNPAFAPTATGEDYESKNARFKLLWEPADLPGFSAKLTYSHLNTNRPTWEATTKPFEDMESMTISNPAWSQRSNVAVADLRYDMGNGVVLTNQLQYSDMHTFRDTNPADLGTAILDQENLSNETRATFGEEGDPISGVVGIYASHTKSDEILYQRGTTTYDDEKDSLGIFSEVNWRFADRWTLSAGLRYQRDHIQRQGESNLSPTPLDYDEEFDAWLPKLSLAYEVTPDTTIGALVSKGYNPGGVSLNLNTGEYKTYDAEKVWNYELFARTHLMDDRLFLSGNLFYSDFRDAQRYVFAEIAGSGDWSSYTINAEKAKSYGLELAMDYRVTDNLRLKAGAGLLRTEITEFSDALGDYEGTDFARAPSHTLTLGADWDVTPKLRLSGDVRHTDGYYSDDANSSDRKVGSYTIVNARAAYTPRDDMEIFAYVNNIFDDDSVTFVRPSASVGGYEATVVEPREIGVGMKMTF